MACLRGGMARCLAEPLWADSPARGAGNACSADEDPSSTFLAITVGRAWGLSRVAAPEKNVGPHRHGHAGWGAPRAPSPEPPFPRSQRRGCHCPGAERGPADCLPRAARRPHSPGPGPCASLSWVLKRTPVSSSARVRLAVPAGGAAPPGLSEAFLLGTPMVQTPGRRRPHARKDPRDRKQWRQGRGGTGGKGGA